MMKDILITNGNMDHSTKLMTLKNEILINRTPLLDDLDQRLHQFSELCIVNLLNKNHKFKLIYSHDSFVTLFIKKFNYRTIIQSLYSHFLLNLIHG